MVEFVPLRCSRQALAHRDRPLNVDIFAAKYDRNGLFVWATRAGGTDFDLVGRIQRLVPSFGGGDDVVGIGLPDERLGVPIVGVDESVEGGLQGDERGEDAAFEPPFGEHGEEGLDCVELGTRRGCEVKHPARMAGEPLLHLGLLVGAVVVEDDWIPAAMRCFRSCIDGQLADRTMRTRHRFAPERPSGKMALDRMIRQVPGRRYRLCNEPLGTHQGRQRERTPVIAGARSRDARLEHLTTSIIRFSLGQN